MKCEELRDLIVLRAAGPLDAGEESAVRSHLDAGCPVCTAEMAAARSVLEMLPYSLDPETPSPMAKARLMAAVGAQSGPALGGTATRPRATGTRAMLGVAAAILTVGVFLMIILRQEQVIDRSESMIATLSEQVERQSQEMAALARQVRAARESIQFVSSPGVLTVDLSGQGDQTKTAARVFWDRSRDSWLLYAANLRAPSPGRTYQLWLVTDAGLKISAGTFDPDAESAAAGTVKVPEGAGNVIAAAVTDEPSGGSPQPTTQPFLLGKI